LIEAGVRFVFVPNPEREGAWAASSPESPLVDDLADIEGLSVAGPEAVLYPNANFADPVHLNPDGAATWSAYLGDLVDDTVCGGG
ncbi:MAG: hypothetical protein ACR2QE_06845, partial [Acidimicrobiales bacterium]